MTWTCAGCGEQVPDNFEICWKCGTSRGAVPPKQHTSSVPDAEAERGRSTPSHADDPAGRTLDAILSALEGQQTTLEEIRWKVGCLFAWMVFWIVICVIAVFVQWARYH